MNTLGKILLTLVGLGTVYGVKDAFAGGVSEPDSLDYVPTEQKINDLDGFLTWYEINVKDLSAGKSHPNPIWLRAQIDELRKGNNFDDCWRIVNNLEGDLALEREIAAGSENYITSLENFLESQGITDFWKLYQEGHGLELPNSLETPQDSTTVPLKLPDVKPNTSYDDENEEECGFWPSFSIGNNTIGAGIDFHCHDGILGVEYLGGFGNSETDLERIVVADQDAPFGSQEISNNVKTNVGNSNYFIGKAGAFVTDNLAFYGLAGIEFHGENTLSTMTATHYDHDGEIIGQSSDPSTYDDEDKRSIALGAGFEYQFSEDFSLGGAVLTDLDNDSFYKVTFKWRFKNE